MGLLAALRGEHSAPPELQGPLTGSFRVLRQLGSGGSSKV